MKQIILLLIALSCLKSSMLTAGVRNQKVGNSRVIDLNEYENLDPVEQNVQLLNAEDTRDDIENEILFHLTDNTPKATKLAAIYLAGAYRIDGAVRLLSPLVELHDPQTDISKRRPLWGEYPVSEALIKIGFPVVPSMLDNICNSSSETTRSLSLNIIRKVLGDNLTSVVLKNAVEKNNNKGHVNHLKDAQRKISGL